MISSTPASPSRPPKIERRLVVLDESEKLSVNAAIGGIVAALRAGERHAARVTTRPTINAAIHVRPAITNGPSGRPAPPPACAIRILRSAAMPIPLKSPIKEAISPMIKPSSITEA